VVGAPFPVKHGICFAGTPNKLKDWTKFILYPPMVYKMLFSIAAPQPPLVVSTLSTIIALQLPVVIRTPFAIFAVHFASGVGLAPYIKITLRGIPPTQTLPRCPAMTISAFVIGISPQNDLCIFVFIKLSIFSTIRAKLF
jgi:hypothetical protein